MAFPAGASCLTVERGNAILTEKEVVPLKKWLTALLVLCLGTGFLLSALALQRSERQSADWRTRAEMAERRAAEANAALELAGDMQRHQSPEDDPIAAFFAALPYSGATDGYLASQEIEAYRTELEHAAKLLEETEAGPLIPAFLAFIDTQAQAEKDAWTASLEEQNAGTAGAWANAVRCQTPIYRFGAYTLISACQRTGETYSFLFDPETARQTLLDAGFREEDLPVRSTV